MGKKKSRHRKSIMRRLFRVIKFTFALLIIVAVYILFKYWPTISSLYSSATVKVSNCTVSTFDTNRSHNPNSVDNKDPLYLKSTLIPQEVKNAFISIEDKDFYKHGGVSTKAILRSAYSLFNNDLKITQGGSTITQQLARNIFLNFEVNYERKFEEMFIAVKLEQKFSKDQILEFYINNINFSNNAFGINTAARKFFNKDCRQLNLSEICFLAAIPNNPEYYDPIKHLNNTLKRRNLILEKMEEYKYITAEQYSDAIKYKIKLTPGKL